MDVHILQDLHGRTLQTASPDLASTRCRGFHVHTGLNTDTTREALTGPKYRES